MSRGYYDDAYSLPPVPMLDAASLTGATTEISAIPRRHLGAELLSLGIKVYRLAMAAALSAGSADDTG